jgi:hypothetical protein
MSLKRLVMDAAMAVKWLSFATELLSFLWIAARGEKRGRK